MSVVIDDTKAIDPALIALGLLLRLHGVRIGLDLLRKRCGNGPIGTGEMLRCAKKFGLKASVLRTNWNGLATGQLPVVARLRESGFLVIGKVTDWGAIVARPSSQDAELMTRAELEARWDGQIVAVARRTSWSDLAGRALSYLSACASNIASQFSEAFTSILHRGGQIVTATRRASWSDLVDRAWPNLSARTSDIANQLSDTFAGILPRTVALSAKKGLPTEPGTTDQVISNDSGLGALVLLLRIHGIGADPAQIRHRCGTATIGVTEMLRCAKAFGLKARASTTKWERLSATPLPG